ncbi:MAG: hypothetical protein QM669_14540 [Siphonobacter sp.]
MGKQNRSILPLGWLKYSAAASVVVLLAAGWWAWRTEPTVLDQSQVVAKATQKIKVIEQEHANPSQRKTERENGVIHDQKTLKQAQTVQLAANAKHIKTEISEKQEVIAKGNEVIKPVEIAAIPTPDKQQEIKPVIPVEQNLAKPNAPVVTSEKVFIVNVTDMNTPEIQADTQAALPRKKGKFFSRLVKSINHIQNGEWKEVGLNGKEILAKAEDTIFKKN